MKTHLARFMIIIVCATIIFIGQNASCETRQEKYSNQEKIKTIENMYSEYEESFKGIPSLDPREDVFNGALFVDVRESKEQQVSEIVGAITQIEFEKSLENYKRKKIIVYCTIGYRSGLYAKKLRDKEFNAYNLKGGVLLWAHAGKVVKNKNGLTKKVHVYGKKWDLLPEGWIAIY